MDFKSWRIILDEIAKDLKEIADLLDDNGSKKLIDPPEEERPGSEDYVEEKKPAPEGEFEEVNSEFNNNIKTDVGYGAGQFIRRILEGNKDGGSREK